MAGARKEGSCKTTRFRGLREQRSRQQSTVEPAPTKKGTLTIRKKVGCKGVDLVRAKSGDALAEAMAGAEAVAEATATKVIAVFPGENEECVTGAGVLTTVGGTVTDKSVADKEPKMGEVERNREKQTARRQSTACLAG